MLHGSQEIFVSVIRSLAHACRQRICCLLHGFRWLNILQKAYTFVMRQCFGVILLDVKLFVDGEEIDLNEFVVKILSGALVGAVTSLRGIREDWKEIEVRVTR